LEARSCRAAPFVLANALLRRVARSLGGPKTAAYLHLRHPKDPGETLLRPSAFVSGRGHYFALPQSSCCCATHVKHSKLLLSRTLRSALRQQLSFAVRATERPSALWLVLVWWWALGSSSPCQNNTHTEILRCVSRSFTGELGSLCTAQANGGKCSSWLKLTVAVQRAPQACKNANHCCAGVIHLFQLKDDSALYLLS